ncbi:calcitonin gene-related peptide type 1 receptor isoform X1 [Rhineura floridana]|uniref:calcitonin gene-related peptide type 1 receptor isoform X1 n=1 Tax=Rhineura floridana TaxID=261503 RepID=UPI002AC81814|nr:calcitonin gene-related peptide type 1 receptor isoform X1 [Rhineura floridana]XP_061464232.1 calcitonin gene-related peptide type 1 receptor isoform X1 [Rhineura floridana]XP_061464233.1 calcitonin gene-related peptide type 1 receptor isoform X1 [Rhineura floridana]XP_061464234.1 calcitonin gene-related peptide type 1 receptor isoform X1 [Rhineura floridana]XP_061464235.1 calcitonin gene-related peptide type 1 receptor isoform X1 [Rhineura floridana]XP_061464236.1 calcitonin gene-related p
METNWIIQLLLLLALTLVFATAIPEEKQWNLTNEVFLLGDMNITDDIYSLGVTKNKIMTAQYECYQKIMQDSSHKSEGPHCNRTWDGWLCWDDVAVGEVAIQNCPDYFQDFDPSEKVFKTCEEKGHWFVHPESNRTWTNYTLCTFGVTAKLKTALNLYYLTIIGHSLSIVSLLISLGIFSYFKSLSCQRITLHKNLFFSFVCNSIVTIISLTGVASNQQMVASNPVGCKVAQFFHFYLMVCNYFWMLCEGIYLHTLIVVAVFAEKQHLLWYYLLGWGFPLIPACIHAVARSIYYNDNCWISSDTHLLYIIHGPICAALLVNLFFLLNIVRVLITKLKVTHQAESNLYMKAVRATLILVPLLGIEFVLVPWRPEDRIAAEIYDYVMHILMHYQGLLVATIFCFFNGEVQSVLRRHWNQYRIQFEHSFTHSDALRSASYTVSSSIADGQSFSYNHDCTSEHLNGKSFHDMDNIVSKPEKLYG